METIEHLQTLVDKLNSLELTEPERVILGQLLGSGEDGDEVEGFSKIFVGNLPVVQGFTIGMPPTLKLDVPNEPGGRVVINHEEQY